MDLSLLHILPLHFYMREIKHLPKIQVILRLKTKLREYNLVPRQKETKWRYNTQARRLIGLSPGLFFSLMVILFSSMHSTFGITCMFAAVGLLNLN